MCLPQAVIGGQHFGTKSLVMSWYQPPAANEDEEQQHEKDVENLPPKEVEVPGEREDVEEEGDELEDELTLDDEGGVSVVIDGLGEEASNKSEVLPESAFKKLKCGVVFLSTCIFLEPLGRRQVFREVISKYLKLYGAFPVTFKLLYVHAIYFFFIK